MLVLASVSPRRSALLTQLGMPHRVIPAHIDERRHDGEPIEQCVRRLAVQKALQVSAMLQAAGTLDQRQAVLGADTTVVLDQYMLEKPRDRQHGLAMLARLSGREHEVLSAVALAYGGRLQTLLSRSLVRLRSLVARNARHTGTAVSRTIRRAAMPSRDAAPCSSSHCMAAIRV